MEKECEVCQSEIMVRLSVKDMVILLCLFHMTFWPIFFRLANFQ